MISAIVYDEENLCAKNYAESLSITANLPMFSITAAKEYLPKHSKIVYLSAAKQSKLLRFEKVKRTFDVEAVGIITFTPLEKEELVKITGASGVRCKNAFCLSNGAASHKTRKEELDEMSSFIACPKKNESKLWLGQAEFRASNLGDLLNRYKLFDKSDISDKKVFC